MSDLVADMEERLKAYHHAMSAMFGLIDTWIAEEAQGGGKAAGAAEARDVCKLEDEGIGFGMCVEGE